MYDDIDNERDFWHDEPTRRLGRLPTRQIARVERTRQHIPVITTPARPTRRPADPFLVRLGLMLCVGIVMLPIAYTLRHGASDMLRTVPTGGATAVPVRSGSVQPTSTLTVEPAAAGVLVADTSAIAVLDVAASPTTAFDIDALPPAVPVNDVDGDVPANTQAPVQQKSSPPATTPATSPATTAVRTTEAPLAEASTKAPVCATSYKVASGDYWIVIADRVGVSLKDLLAANNATVKTALYPGREICLPKGASSPTTGAPATTAPAKATPTTAKPATAKPPATTAAPTTTLPRRTYTAAEVESIIREVWPDDLEDEAVRIARRESNLQPTARNSCCIGLFQIYWTVHKGWLTAMGITSADQLFDPRVNATAGFALYQRSGGWGPWAL